MKSIAELWQVWGVVGASVLVVDDEPDYATLTGEFLRRVGAGTVLQASSPSDAVAVFEAERPELALIDYHLGAATGIDVVAALRIAQRHHDELAIVMQTGSRSAEIRKEALTHLVTDFVLKDHDPTEMLLRVGKALRARRLALHVHTENERLEAAVQERTGQLERANRETFVRLARAAALRDEDTAEHTGRVGALTEAIAGAVGMGPKEAATLGRAAELHDIGKIGVPDAILRKPGPLTSEERTIMETHAALGEALLEGGEDLVLRLATIVAASHHERWDGNGYPYRLAGDAVPLEGRIVAVADAYDAMTKDRPYRKAMTAEAACGILRIGSGSQWDPKVVAAFLRIVSTLSEGQPGSVGLMSSPELPGRA